MHSTSAVKMKQSPPLLCSVSEAGGLGLKEFCEMGMLMLVCAVLASLALGVLVAYGICHSMFHLFKVHAVSAARSRSAARTQGLRVQES